MPTTKGFFSVIQFCPDLDRGECANVGVVLAVPELGFLGVHFSDDNEGPKQRFGKDSFDDGRLSIAKQALEGRIRSEGKDWRSVEELQRFGRKEGNNLVLAAPRTILVESAAAEIEELFQRLVYVEARHPRPRQRKPDLGRIFEPELFNVPLMRNVDVEVPELGKWQVPYAYRNGRLNLIRPEGFSIDEDSATAKANDLAVRAHLIYKHPAASGEQRQLVVVGGFDPSASERQKQRIGAVLREHDARLIREDDISQLIEEVRRDAH